MRYVAQSVNLTDFPLDMSGLMRTSKAVFPELGEGPRPPTPGADEKGPPNLIEDLC